MRTKRAQLIAEAVAVVCPSCGEPQPNKAGSQMWTPDDFRNLINPIRKCVSCDQELLISSDPKVQFIQ